MKKILVFHRTFFRISETFIHRQVVGLEENFSISLLAINHYENVDRFKVATSSQYVIPKPKSIIDRMISVAIRKFGKAKLPFSIGTQRSLSRLLKTLRIDMIHAHYGWNGVMILSLAKRNNIPLIVSFHGNDASAALRKETYKNALPELFEYASAIIICSPHMIDMLSVNEWRHKVKLVPYGVDQKFFAPWQIKVIDTIKIIHVGRLVPKKGVPDLIRAFSVLLKTHNNIELYIIGDGEEFDVCKLLTAELSIENKVTFYGAQSIDSVRDFMNHADIFVLNSRTDDRGDMEGLPNVLLEAMSLEKAVVSTQHAGIPFVVKDGINGLLVPERRNDLLSEAMGRCIKDKELRMRLGKNARKTVIEEFSIQKMQLALKEIFTNILDAHERND